MAAAEAAAKSGGKDVGGKKAAAAAKRASAAAAKAAYVQAQFEAKTAGAAQAEKEAGEKRMLEEKQRPLSC